MLSDLPFLFREESKVLTILLNIGWKIIPKPIQICTNGLDVHYNWSAMIIHEGLFGEEFVNWMNQNFEPYKGNEYDV